jgi:hypothetical protein
MLVSAHRQKPATLIQKQIQYGLFSPKYFLQNLAYLTVQGFHIEFSGPTMTDIAGLDIFGTSLLAASPFLILIFFVPITRTVTVGILTATAMIIPMLYHSNGAWQFNVQRYTLDWLPILFLWLPLVLINSDRMNIFRILGMCAIVLNIVSVVTFFCARPLHNLTDAYQSKPKRSR